MAAQAPIWQAQVLSDGRLLFINLDTGETSFDPSAGRGNLPQQQPMKTQPFVQPTGPPFVTRAPAFAPPSYDSNNNVVPFSVAPSPSASPFPPSPNAFTLNPPAGNVDTRSNSVPVPSVAPPAQTGTIGPAVRPFCAAVSAPTGLAGPHRNVPPAHSEKHPRHVASAVPAHHSGAGKKLHD